MLQNIFPPANSTLRSCKAIIPALLFSGCLVAHSSTALAEYVVSGVQAESKGQDLMIRIQGSETPVFSTYELFKPARVVVDINEARIQDGTSLTLPAEYKVQLKTSTIDSSSPAITRLEFQLDRSAQFKAAKQGNDILLTLTASPDQAGPPPSGGTVVDDIKVTTKGNQTRILLAAEGAIKDFKYSAQDKKGSTAPRLNIDINNAKGSSLLPEKLIGTSVSRILTANRGSGLRVVLEGADTALFPFQINPVPEGLEILVEEKDGNKDSISMVIGDKAGIEGQLPKVTPLKGSVQTSTALPQDAFSFSGYNKERISVDFYKIDLHNVFRLLREVSGANIIVDEEVEGALTLALNDVPWDFALDIILNLKDLQKEERFNTIVILPRDKTFDWGNFADNNLSFEQNEEITEQEALLISQLENMPPEVIEAKQEISKGKEFEQREDFETAALLYEKAYDLWPKNGKLAAKISSLYLTQLRQNAKALFYAKKALEQDSKLYSAALNAGIALASMDRPAEAQSYFDQSVSGKTPSKESLISYAIFSEAQKRLDVALKLLARHDQLHGESMNSMIATARILDKQGKAQEATELYKRLLLSGYAVPPDLKQYIQGRLALQQNM